MDPVLSKVPSRTAISQKHKRDILNFDTAFRAEKEKPCYK